MKIKVHFYIVKLICSVILFVLILSALHFIVRQGSQLFEFFFARSFVQYVTIYIFAFTVILLGSRTIFFLRNTQQFNAARKGKRILSDQTKTVNEVLMKSGAEAAISFVNHMIKEEKNKISKSYEIINFLLCSLPACGLFGTMLGLSNSLFTAFSAGVGREKGIQQFVTALSTALDTTVLAMACAMFLGGFAWVMGRLEYGLIEQYARFIRSTFSFDKLAVELKNNKTPEPDNNHAHNAIDIFRTELRVITTEILEEALVKCTDILNRVEESFRVHLESAGKNIFEKQRNYEKTMITQIASHIALRMNESIDQVGNLIDKHNAHAAKKLGAQLSQLEKTIRKRVPNQVIIRYDNNGNHTQEQDTVEV